MAWGRDPTAGLGYLIQKNVEILHEAAELVRLGFDEELLNSDKCTLFELLADADLCLAFEPLNQLHALLSINARAEVIQHEVVVKQHIEEKVAAFAK